VREGQIRVVLTTNFDRLTERAIEAQSITPTVIATREAAEGAVPLVHSPCTVIKLHGDYLEGFCFIRVIVRVNGGKSLRLFQLP
jgi:hypothetical protein